MHRSLLNIRASNHAGRLLLEELVLSIEAENLKRMLPQSCTEIDLIVVEHAVYGAAFGAPCC